MKGNSKMNRRFIHSVVFASAVVILLCGSAFAKDGDGVNAGFGSVMGQLSTAEVIPAGAIDIGPYFGFYEDATALFGRFCVGLVSSMQLEVKSGILDTDGFDDPGFMIGSGVQFQIVRANRLQMPDMAMDVEFEYYDFGEDVSEWVLGSGFIASYPLRLSNNAKLTPYGRLGIRIESISVGDYDDTDFDIGMNLGAQYAPGKRLQFFGELQFDDQVGVIAGVNFAIY